MLGAALRRITPIIVIALTVSAAGADWPMFRQDPLHNGFVQDGTLGEPQMRWATLLGESVDSSPAVADGVVYVGTSEGALCALDAEDGGELWRYETGGAIVSSPAVSEGLALFGSVDRFFYAAKCDSGELAWQYRTYGPVVSSPTCEQGVVYFSSIGGRVYACSVADGKLIWRRGGRAGLLRR